MKFSPPNAASCRALRDGSAWLAAVLGNERLAGAGPGAVDLPANAAPFEWVSVGGMDWLSAAVACGSSGMRATTEQVYRRLLESLEGRRLYRVWNFVPRINEPEAGLETYQQFSFGRSVAFEATFASECEARLPAASAVGTPGDRLILVAMAGRSAPAFLENPAQVPAYRYPERFGPRSPSFARAATVTVAGRRYLFVSGTASIRGSVTLHSGDVAAQTELTVDNLRLISAEAGFDLRAPADGEHRFFRVYLRQAEDYAEVWKILRAHLLQDTDEVEVLQAEICRADLAVEIEATLITPADCR